MKTLYGLILIVSFAAVLFGGISLVNNQALVNNNNLDSDSIALVGIYDKDIGNISSYKNTSKINTQLSSNNTNQVESFFREYAETKSNVEKFKDGVNFVLDIPEVLFLSIPFIDSTDKSLIIYKTVLLLLITFIILAALIKAVRASKVDDE